MAQKGMFGSQYQQAVVDETRQRQEQARTGGLTGWAAITDAMSGIGSEIGYAGGQAMGMQTAAQQQSQRFDSVMNSMPDFDMTDPEQAKLMSSKMYSEGFYDDAMTLLKESQEMQKVDALMKYYEDIGSGNNKTTTTTTKRDSGVSAAELAIALDLTKKNFKDAWYDFTDPDLPAGSSEEGLSLFIAQTARNTNSSMDEVISLIKSGQLKISQGTTAASTTPAGGANLNLDPTTTLLKR
tara:strand:+ start:78 stop:794 length:717 start_codon:yes stop_codon:yes gene_type:complete